jgi:hypothetical protein
MERTKSIQFITNSRQLRRNREVNAGGSQKDFFKGRDKDFVRHRNAIASDLSSISERLRTEHARFNGEGYVEVRLTREAWAKSHRPVDKLFSSKRATLVGGADIADLVFRVSSASLEQVANSVMSAEDEPEQKIDKRSGERKPVISELRSETGAIEAVVLWGGEQRAVPSPDEAIAYFRVHGLAACYRIELFDRIGRPAAAEDRAKRAPLASDFWARIKQLSQLVGIAVTLLPLSESDHPVIGITLLAGEPRLLVTRDRALINNPNIAKAQNFDKEAHGRLLRLLAAHPLVRSVELPGVFEVQAEEFTQSRVSARSRAGRAPAAAAILRRPSFMSDDSRYPLVAVVDGGISGKFDRWVAHRYAGSSVLDESHGSGVASLLVAGKALNPGLSTFLEEDGCLLIDLALQPGSPNPTLYPAGAISLLDHLELQLREITKQYPLRVINFSLNVERIAEGRKASETARRLDEIARKHDVIFVVSAGNARGAEMRKEWPKSTTSALQNLASAGGDRLYEPADTICNVSVAAVNSLNVRNAVDKAPARYSRRGLNLRAAKPDFAHIGGTYGSPGAPTGLVAYDEGGTERFVSGTSYAAPLVAKTLASLDRALDYVAPREVLLALLYHNAEVHDPLLHKDLISQARQLVGFGIPRPSADILAESAASFTFVFFEHLSENECFKREFTWPASLVKPGGKCSGRIRATLVSSPPLIYRFGAEAARVNVDFYLRQANGKARKDGSPSFEGRVKALRAGNTRGSDEEGRIGVGLKWSPVKAYEGILDETGVSSTFQLSVEYLERDRRQNIPDAGIPVAVVVTIDDPSGMAPVNNEMYASLNRSGLRLNDIRNALRVDLRNRGE